MIGRRANQSSARSDRSASDRLGVSKAVPQLILAVRTDRPRAEIYLIDQTGQPVKQKIWLADRQLSQSLLAQIKALADLEQLVGIVVYEGPGSFTGLRIGISVANALAYALNIPVAGASGKDWQSLGVASLHAERFGTAVMPKYGAPPHITPPRK